MEIMFVDFIDWDYSVETPFQRPLGGTQSAVCYLAVELALRGHGVTLLNQSGNPKSAKGVTCASLKKPVSKALMGKQDVVIVISSGSAYGIENMLRPDQSLILWTQHAIDQPAVQTLSADKEKNKWDTFVFVSDWQKNEYIKNFVIDSGKTKVLRNAVAPFFEKLTRSADELINLKPVDPVLVYTSTPFRGLDIVAETFPQIKEAVPNVRLKIFSSMKVYQVKEEEDAFKDLYKRLSNMDGAEYAGAVPQDQLADELTKATLLYYPNSFVETSCIGVMEALASGCRVLTTELAALPETCADFGTLVPWQQDRDAFGREFIETCIHLLKQMKEKPEKQKNKLRAQVDYAAKECCWGKRAQEWEQYLERICAEKKSSLPGKN